ncbi:hypothetical protein [Roseiflexus sp.]|uniref:hypothetical protein n=1 Tax=Roseiflexus sp. TaxID=2562120 RepID=UPI00398B0FE6
MVVYSDIDLLVIKRGDFNSHQAAGNRYRQLHGVGRAVDIILVNPEPVEQHRHTHCLIITSALREGREASCAAAMPAR